MTTSDVTPSTAAPRDAAVVDRTAARPPRLEDGAADATAAGVTIPDRRRPVAPVPPPKRLRLPAAWRAIGANPIAAFPEEAYRAPIVRLGQIQKFYVVNDPAAIERVLVDNAANYLKSRQQQRRIGPALGDGLLTAEGETWRQARRIAAPLFTPRAIATLYDDMAAAAAATAARWAPAVAAGEPMDLAAEYQRLTYDIVSATVFSGALDADRVRMHEKMALYFETIGRIDIASLIGLPEWVPTLGHLRARSALKVFREVVGRAFGDRTAARARGETPPGDLLDRLIDARDPKGGGRLPDRLVLDNVLTFLAAGHETTGNALAWISYLLATFPWADARLAEEFASVLGGRAAMPADFERLPFARALVDETLRLYPPAPFLGREAIGEDVVAGVPIPPGTQLVISPWIVHRHRDLWEDPDLFAPGRFAPERRAAMARGTFIPFGLGPRVCIGQSFALQEILTVLSVIAQAYRFTLPAGTEIYPQSRVTLQARGLNAIVTRR